MFHFIQHDLECLLNELLQYLPTEYSNRLKLFWWVWRKFGEGVVKKYFLLPVQSFALQSPCGNNNIFRELMFWTRSSVCTLEGLLDIGIWYSKFRMKFWEKQTTPTDAVSVFSCMIVSIWEVSMFQLGILPEVLTHFCFLIATSKLHNQWLFQKQMMFS